ncbi:kinase suppressor of Ras 1 [Anopheles ziemanni]|uniref:kinase suppressor of Ras 1 n=1 Tax=Anopheles coustani TaxID=139045 RepID=UPI00265AE1F1|nr:kinase suppressor of Ras 1 [Anopheles coustani]XP_058173532.1 kinase suppressor of Ras 1 [Anopheles ziemanni]
MMANNNSCEAKAAASATTSSTQGGEGGPGGDDGSDVSGGSDSSEVNIRRGLDVIQSMIDISADRLEGLRTQCATSAELTQQEIRTLETKLVKLFSDLLITKSKLPERLPARGLPATGNELKQWLRVVGLSCASLKAVIQQVSTLEGLLEKDEKELRTIMGNNVYVREEEIKRLTRACGNLRRCREQLEPPAADGSGRKGMDPPDLFWDSWDRQPACHRTSPRVNRSLAGSKCTNKQSTSSGVSYQQRHNNGPTGGQGSDAMHHQHHHHQLPTTSTSPQSEESVPQMQHQQQPHHHHHHHHHQQQHDSLLNPHHTISPDEASTSGCTPSPSPPNSPSNVLLHNNKQNRKGGFPTTPPPKRKHQTALLSTSASSCSTAASTAAAAAAAAVVPASSTTGGGAVVSTSTTTSSTPGGVVDATTALTKSKSHESQFVAQQQGGLSAASGGHVASNVVGGAHNNNNNNGHSNGGNNNSSGHNNNNSINHINNNIPSTVVSLGPDGPPSLTTTASPNLPTSGGGASGTFVSHQQQRLLANGSASNRLVGTFSRTRLHTEPTVTSSGSSSVSTSASGGIDQHHLLQGQGPPGHHYYHHGQQHQAGNTSSELGGGEYGGIDPGIPPHPATVPPKSPCTPIITRGMGHMIQHRFTKKFKVTKSTCDLCLKQMYICFKCTECKFRCHKDCKSSVPPSCGLPQEFVDEFKKSLQSDTLCPSVSPNIGRGGGGGGGNPLMYGGGVRGGGEMKPGMPRGPMHAIHACGGGPDSSSAGSSCNSSSPSSPALLSLPPQTPATSKHSQFNFPEVGSGGAPGGAGGSMMTSTSSIVTGGSMATSGGSDRSGSGGVTLETHPIAGGGNASSGLGSLGSNSHTSTAVDVPRLQFPDNQAEHNVPGGGEDKTGSASATSTDSSSDRTPIRLDSTEERDHESSWPRQNSLSLKEWDIPYDDLHLKEKIGNGRFGTVHRALWHGDVAVKLLKEDYVADESTLEAFKLEVATFKKTRHENVVLFMGACMKPPRLAIVTSLCKGNTLYTHIHLRKDKFNLNRTTLVAQQISQGMGYLHARGIVHKDLKTKNIFLENGKVIITDFGLFSATKLLYCELGLGIPGGWLCYLAPELMRNLTPYRPVEGDLPFSRASDIYAFGTVWYELLCGEFPFKSQPAESIIWQVGRGMKQTLANLQASRDVKDILIQCWSYHSDDRPDFAKLLSNLERLPKKRLARSPSHPVQLSRSAESVF